MSPWLERALMLVATTQTGLVVVLDPDGIVEAAVLNGHVVDVGDWWAMRSIYEIEGRRRAADNGRFVLIIRAALAMESLPFDIERAARAVVSIRLPGPPACVSVLAELGGEKR